MKAMQQTIEKSSSKTDLNEVSSGSDSGKGTRNIDQGPLTVNSIAWSVGIVAFVCGVMCILASSEYVRELAPACFIVGFAVVHRVGRTKNMLHDN